MIVPSREELGVLGLPSHPINENARGDAVVELLADIIVPSFLSETVVHRHIQG
jgi:hypothetical protein